MRTFIKLILLSLVFLTIGFIGGINIELGTTRIQIIATSLFYMAGVVVLCYALNYHWPKPKQ